MDVRDDHGSGSDGRGHTPYGAGANVTDHEGSGDGGLRVVRLSAAVVGEAGTDLIAEVASSQDVTAFELDRVGQPGGLRHCADHDEHLVGRHLHGAFGSGQGDHLELAVAGDVGDLGLGVDRDVRRCLDLLHEVVAHLVADQAATDDQVDCAAIALGEVHGRLTGRVSSAHDKQLLVGVAALEGGRAVAHPLVQVAHQVHQREPPVLDAHRESDGTRSEAVSHVVGDGEESGRLVAVQPAGQDGGDHVGLEPGRLLLHAIREFLTGHPTGEAGVVLDVRAGAGLASEL